MPKLSRDSLETGRVYFLLSIDVGGLVFRWASSPCSPVNDAGDSMHHPGALPAFEFSRTFSLLSRDPDTRQVSMSVDFGVDVAELVQRGYDLSAASGELSVWVAGTSYDAREVLLRGVLVEPTYGEYGEPTSFTLRMDPWEDLGAVPDSDAQVNAATWPSHYSEETGAVYPVPFGLPGWEQAGSVASFGTTGSPAIIVEYDDVAETVEKVLVSGFPVAATDATLVDGDGGNTFLGLVTHEEDGLGRTCAVVDTSGASSGFRAAKKVWVTLSGPGAFRGAGAGIFGTSSTEFGLSGAGDLLMWLLARAQVEVDIKAFRAARGLLNQYQVGGYINEIVSPVQWIIDNLLPILPVSLVSGPNGVKPIVWAMDATSDDAVMELVAGAGVTRSSPVSYLRGPADIANEIQVSYAPRARTGEMTRVLTLGSEYDPNSYLEDPDPEDHPAQIHGQAYSRISQSRYGRRVYTTESDLIHSDATAGMVAAWMMRAMALPQRTVSYVGGAVCGYLEPGDVVALTDAAMHFNAQVCLVVGSTWTSETSVTLDLLITDDPVRDR